MIEGATEVFIPGRNKNRGSRGYKMKSYWVTVNDDNLNLVDKMSDFLQSEFCPPTADQMWSPEYFRWKLGSPNPAGNGFVSLAMIDEQVVGCISITKKRLLVNGKEYLGAEIGDSYSSAVIRRRGRPLHLSSFDSDPKSYINRSIFGRLASEVRARAEDDGVSIIYGTPNKNAYPGWTKRLGYYDLVNYYNKTFFRPTSKFLVRKYPLLKFIKPILRGTEISWEIIQKHIYNQFQNKNLTYEICAPTEDELNDLWLHLKPACGFSLIRDASYWRHRYLEHPIAKYNYFSIREKNSLVGIVVTRLHMIEDNKCYVSITEWMIKEHIQFGYILSMILEYYRNSGVDVFNYWADKSSEEARAAGKNLFVTRGKKPIIVADSPDGQLLLSMSSGIQFYIGSSDAV